MQLAILTAVLAAIAAGEAGGGPVTALGWRLVVVALAMSIAPLAALVGAQRLNVSAALSDTEEKASRLETLVAALWLATVALILLVAQWPRIVRTNWQLVGLPLVDELIILTPVIVPLLLIWAALHGRQRLAAYLWQQTRQQLGLLLVPPLAVVGILETLTWLKITPANIDAAWWFALPLVGMILVLMPVAVRRIWQTTPLIDSPLRERLDAICIGRRCHLREILIWHTGGMTANAAVVGVWRWLRYLLLSDALLARLSDDQVAGVVRHELAHLRRWHLPLRLSALLLPVAWWLALQRAWPEAIIVANETLRAVALGSSVAVALAVPLGLLMYAIIVVGWYSRLLEHDADLDACLDDCCQIDVVLAADFCSALVTLCGRGRESWTTQWLHPRVDRRLDFVRRVIDNRRLVDAFRRRLRLIWMAIVLLFAAAAAVALVA